ncbi:HAD family hydrolase [Paludibacterium yongneupense]|uniref:HAD family hydrolase n=1 Tax=Paludibacterium yongneupense TaxID=400061 RepID=UPI00048C7C72|nr:HAD family phosphatase [Paludibacterium yongneupense]
MKPVILWDNDGVLADTEVLFYQANRAFLSPYGIHLSEQEFYKWFLCRDIGAWHLLRAQGWTEDDVAMGRLCRNKLYRDMLDASSELVKPGMDELVLSFSGRARMAVVTSSRREHFDRIHKQSMRKGILNCLEHVIAAGDYLKAKPDPEPYRVALGRMGVPPERCIAVEDSPRGMQAAQAAGVPCIVVQTPLTRGHQFENAFAVVDSLSQLRSELEHWFQFCSA